MNPFNYLPPTGVNMSSSKEMFAEQISLFDEQIKKTGVTRMNHLLITSLTLDVFLYIHY